MLRRLVAQQRGRLGGSCSAIVADGSSSIRRLLPRPPAAAAVAATARGLHSTPSTATVATASALLRRHFAAQKQQHHLQRGRGQLPQLFLRAFGTSGGSGNGKQHKTHHHSHAIPKPADPTASIVAGGLHPNDDERDKDRSRNVRILKTLGQHLWPSTALHPDAASLKGRCVRWLGGIGLRWGWLM